MQNSNQKYSICCTHLVFGKFFVRMTYIVEILLAILVFVQLIKSEIEMRVEKNGKCGLNKSELFQSFHFTNIKVGENKHHFLPTAVEVFRWHLKRNGPVFI